MLDCPMAKSHGRGMGADIPDCPLAHSSMEISIDAGINVGLNMGRGKGRSTLGQH